MADLQTPLPIRLAQTMGLTTAGLLAGANISFSLIALPRILESPTPLLIQQWKNMFESGKFFMPPIALLSSSMLFYLASQARSPKSVLSEDRFWGYVAAGVLALSIVPYTLLFMNGTNSRLLVGEKEVESTVRELVRKWGRLNLGRSVLLVGSLGVGAWSVVN
ncbi:Noranthrone monooxygenase [Lachnellula hyalina]|uniref:Noranthrone monooxygenase n=1 Tax=Lachnellula hyalina TaxID=1316788 RepID=A0A8H8QUC0_9HELO|nr:Noranthrone monooxygenase [Lachnellula hyalina]TVY22928.1 Noranthrone monooxygenase [Lachnellula hyalina]